MSLRVRLALMFALVAIVTAGAIALVTPAIVDHVLRSGGHASGREALENQPQRQGV